MSELSRRSLITLGLAAGAAAVPAIAAVAEVAKPRNAVLGNGGLHHAAIRVRDWEQTLRFYQEVLGCTVKLAWEEGTGTLDERISGSRPRSQRWAYLDTGDGTCIEIFDDPTFVPPAPSDSDPTKSPGGALVHFGLRTTRIDQVYEHARAHGATVAGKPADFTLHSTTGQGPVVVRLCFLQGPNGEWIELLQNAP